MKSFLDNDIYKFTTQQAIFFTAPNAIAKFKFKDRGNASYNDDFLYALKKEISRISDIRIKNHEIAYLKKLPYFKSEYLKCLRGLKLNSEYVQVDLDNTGRLSIDIAGPWIETTLWEVPLLYTISQLYFRHCDMHWSRDDQCNLAERKLVRLSEHRCKFIEGGTRRRRSSLIQDDCLDTFSYFNADNFLGTSNAHFAKIYGIEPRGTMPHEWIMGCAALFGLPFAYEKAMMLWSDISNFRLGSVPTDTYTTDYFFKQFNGMAARIYDGVKQDSGDPFDIGHKIIKHYQSLGINPKYKQITFSDGLDVDTCIRLQREFEDITNPVFLIGTHLTNDFTGSPPLNIVIKLNELNKNKVCKISDSPGKEQGDLKCIQATKERLNL